MANYKQDMTNNPIDASMGLVFRLNRLWSLTDSHAAAGDLEKWDGILERIYCNLMYKDEFELVRNADGEIVEVKLSPKDIEITERLNHKVIIAKDKMKNAYEKRKRSLYIDAKNEFYEALKMKDIGLRKLMFALKLYMKQSDSNPSRAMWGG
jgi:hypothetical protein